MTKRIAAAALFRTTISAIAATLFILTGCAADQQLSADPANADCLHYRYGIFAGLRAGEQCTYPPVQVQRVPASIPCSGGGWPYSGPAG